MNNKPNHDIFYNNFYNGESLHTKSYFHNIEGPKSAQSFIHPSSVHQNHHMPSTSLASILLNDNLICDGMDNCHLTESWANYMNQNINLPITQISNQIPILNSYVPIQQSLELQAFSNRYYHQQFHVQQQQQQNYFMQKNYLEAIHSSHDHYKYLRMTENSSNSHPQQHLLRDGFSRLDELDYEQNNKSEQNSHQTNDINLSDVKDVNEPEYYHHKIKTCIKFQDRNKKLDFKVNFRDENRKVNGCFHDFETISPKSREIYSMDIDDNIEPPKKKWLKTHLLTVQQAGEFINNFRDEICCC